ncbi:CoA-substrate-specific enzyme activase, putative [Papillibacter cinnamivorans DSM 12816]|uniref:CoA-substrate-specific enzyme activase, putative n=1 Tax=Papillibacter cinnamivorans DSM 12816 TaxID=1122930 RepID=A0A1W1YNV0_9FIRM|nr:CoA-substrate-specific enzyme activase, putative [Papillibacter cinnamivorans DSM 12816]
MDVGSVSTKGVVLDSNGEIIAAEYLWTEGDPVTATKKTVLSLQKQLPASASIRSVGTTGSARKLIGAMLEADSVKNEITAHAKGTLSRHPDVRTILEIGGQDSKIILIDNGVVIDYAMNTLCAAGTGAFLSSQAKRLGIPVEELGDMALQAGHPARIAARCTVFAESDMVHKAQAGYAKEDLVAGLCDAIVANYLNNVGKGKRIESPVVFQGGVSKNRGVVRAFQAELGSEIHVDADSHLMGAVGAALLSRGAVRAKPFECAIVDLCFQTRAHTCPGCANHCEIISFYRDGVLLDSWGNRCEKGRAAEERKEDYLTASRNTGRAWKI